MGSSAEDEEPIKSKPSRERSFVKFVNRTRKPVDIIWKGFNGDNIRYVTRLAHARHFNVNTFVSHPWQAWNSDTFSIMNTGGGLVFYPTKWNERDGRKLVYIDEPVSTLLTLCLEKIKSLVDIDDLDQLEIPRILIEELKKRRSVEVQDIQQVQR